MFINAPFRLSSGSTSGGQSRRAAPLGRLRRQFIGRVLRNHVWSIADRHAAVQMLMHDDRLSCQGIPPARFVQLKDAIFQRQMVLSLFTVRSCCTLKIQSRSLRRARTNALPFCAALHRKPAVELGDVFVPQELVGLGQIRDSAHPQLLRQAALPGAEIALRSASSPAANRPAIIFTPSSCKARPTCVGRLASTRSPRFGVTKK